MDRRACGCCAGCPRYRTLHPRNPARPAHRLPAEQHRLPAEEIAALKDALAGLQARLARPELTPAAAAAKEIAGLRDALAELKARMDQAQRPKPDGK